MIRSTTQIRRQASDDGFTRADFVELELEDARALTFDLRVPFNNRNTKESRVRKGAVIAALLRLREAGLLQARLYAALFYSTSITVRFSLS